MISQNITSGRLESTYVWKAHHYSGVRPLVVMFLWRDNRSKPFINLLWVIGRPWKNQTETIPLWVASSSMPRYPGIGEDSSIFICRHRTGPMAIQQKQVWKTWNFICTSWTSTLPRFKIQSISRWWIDAIPCDMNNEQMVWTLVWTLPIAVIYLSL